MWAKVKHRRGGQMLFKDKIEPLYQKYLDYVNNHYVEGLHNKVDKVNKIVKEILEIEHATIVFLGYDFGEIVITYPVMWTQTQSFANGDRGIYIGSQTIAITKYSDTVRFVIIGSDDKYNDAYVYAVLTGNNRCDNFCSALEDMVDIYHTEMQTRSQKIMKENSKSFDRVFLPSELKQQIIEDISGFLESREIYEKDLKLPWKRGYVFYGEAGNGKSLMIRSIARHFGLCIQDITHNIDKKGELSLDEGVPMGGHYAFGLYGLHVMKYKFRPKPTLYYLEDIDKITASQGDDIPRISLASLLKGLDGASAINGAIIIATTNHITDMAEALMARPGRFDSIFEFKKPDESCIKQMFDYYSIEIMDGNMNDVIKKLKNYSMAFVEEVVKIVLMRYKRTKIKYSEIEIVLKKIKEHNEKYKKCFKEKMGFHKEE